MKNHTTVKNTAFAATLAIAMSQTAFAQSAPQPVNADSVGTDTQNAQHADENSGTYWGVGIGTALGAIIGGPVGAAAGAALGGSFGYGHDKGEAFEQTESRLDARTLTLSQLEGELKSTQRTLAKLKTKNATITRKHALQASELADLKAQEVTEREQAEILANVAKHYSHEVYYRHNESSIPDYAKTRINELGNFMAEHPSIKISLQGHSDLLGPENANLALSQARVDALRDYLVDQGIADTRIETHAHGETFATVTPGDATNYVLDRRVSIQLDVASTEAQPVVMHAGGR